MCMYGQFGDIDSYLPIITLKLWAVSPEISSQIETIKGFCAIFAENFWLIVEQSFFYYRHDVVAGHVLIKPIVLLLDNKDYND